MKKYLVAELTGIAYGIRGCNDFKIVEAECREEAVLKYETATGKMGLCIGQYDEEKGMVEIPITFFPGAK